MDWWTFWILTEAFIVVYLLGEKNEMAGEIKISVGGLVGLIAAIILPVVGAVVWMHVQLKERDQSIATLRLDVAKKEDKDQIARKLEDAGRAMQRLDNSIAKLSADVGQIRVALKNKIPDIRLTQLKKAEEKVAKGLPEGWRATGGFVSAVDRSGGTLRMETPDGEVLEFEIGQGLQPTRFYGDLQKTIPLQEFFSERLPFPAVLVHDPIGASTNTVAHAVKLLPPRPEIQ